MAVVATKLAAAPLHDASHRAQDAGEGGLGCRPRCFRGLLAVLGSSSSDRRPAGDALPPEPRDRLRIGVHRKPLTVGPILFTRDPARPPHPSRRRGCRSRSRTSESLGVLGIFTNLLTGSLVLGAVLGGLLGVRRVADRARRRSPRELPRDRGRDRRALRGRVDPGRRGRARPLAARPDLPVPDRRGRPRIGARILDLGCGRGLIGVLVGLLTRASMPRSYLGVDQCDRYIRAARQALEDFPGCAVQTFDLRDFDPPAADVVVVNDVLRFLPFAAQDALLRRLARALPPGARLFVREKDASGGWRFAAAAFWDAAQDRRSGPSAARHPPPPRGRLRNALIAAGFSVRDRTVQRAASPAWVLLEAVQAPGRGGTRLMRALTIARARRPGGPGDPVGPEPSIGPEEVLVRVRASALNRADLLQRRGSTLRPRARRPTFPGWSSPARSRPAARWSPRCNRAIA